MKRIPVPRVVGCLTVCPALYAARLAARLALCLAVCLGALALADLGSGVAAAASPQVETAIKAIKSVGNDPEKLKLFCQLNKLLQEAGDKEDAATQKQIEDLVTKIGSDFGAAWDVGDELDENSPDGQEFYAAVDTIADKCQQ
ncbi:MAG: hypothetical protein J2P50_14600 [Hyphomicrobiaceae bacterium]|nr:hypothetical protein [Hyphomicrobiaceae bacterium]